MAEEHLQLVDRYGRLLGSVRREICHGQPRYLHAVVHLHIFDTDRRLFLQKRALLKDRFPGKWDTSVGGHIRTGESVRQALRRETIEELGIEVDGAIPWDQYIYRDDYESEYVFVFGMQYNGRLQPNPAEVETGSFLSAAEIEQKLSAGLCTPHFEHAFKRLLPRFRDKDGLDILRQ